MHIHKIIGTLIVLFSLSMIGYQATKNESSVTFFTPAEVYASPQKFETRTFRVSGLVLEGSKNWDVHKQTLTFQMSDLKGHDFVISYKGLPPDLFKERQGVIVEGRLQNESIPPLEHDLAAPKQDVIPQQDNVIPRLAGVIPQQESVIPQQESVIPQQESVIPQQESVIPQQESVIPQQESVIPQQESVIPRLDRGIQNAPLHINANLLMVKHSEVYDTKQDHSQMREIKLRESLFSEN